MMTRVEIEQVGCQRMEFIQRAFGEPRLFGGLEDDQLDSDVALQRRDVRILLDQLPVGEKVDPVCATITAPGDVA